MLRGAKLISRKISVDVNSLFRANFPHHFKKLTRYLSPPSFTPICETFMDKAIQCILPRKLS